MNFGHAGTDLRLRRVLVKDLLELAEQAVVIIRASAMAPSFHLSRQRRVRMHMERGLQPHRQENRQEEHRYVGLASFHRASNSRRKDRIFSDRYGKAIVVIRITVMAVTLAFKRANQCRNLLIAMPFTIAPYAVGHFH